MIAVDKTVDHDKKCASWARNASPTLARAMARYAERFRHLSAKSADLKGFPFHTRFRFAYGGAPPSVTGSAGASARGLAENATTTAAGWSAAESAERSTGSGSADYIASSTAGAFARSLVGGMFAKRRASKAGDTWFSGGSRQGCRSISCCSVCGVSVST